MFCILDKTDFYTLSEMFIVYNRVRNIYVTIMNNITIVTRVYLYQYYTVSYYSAPIGISIGISIFRNGEYIRLNNI